MNLDLIAIIGTIVAFAAGLIWQIHAIQRLIQEQAHSLEELRLAQTRDHETLRERQVQGRGVLDSIARDVSKIRNGRD